MRENEREGKRGGEKRGNVCVYVRKRRRKRGRREVVDLALVRDRKSAEKKRKETEKREQEREREEDERAASYTWKDEDSEQLQTLSCVVPSWGKAPGYDSFRWFVKRLRELRGVRGDERARNV